MPFTGYLKNIYTDENQFSPTFGSTYEEKIYDEAACPTDMALTATVKAEEGSVWTLTTENLNLTYPITMFVDGVECTTFTATGEEQTLEFACDGSVLTIAPTSYNYRLYLNRDSGNGDIEIAIEKLNMSVTTSYTVSKSYASIFARNNYHNRVISAKNITTDNAYFLFYNQSYLNAVDLSNSTAVTTLQSAFYGCSSLTSLTLPESMPALTTLNCAFYGCSSLTSLTLPESMPAVTTLYWAFYGCSSLTSLTLPESMPAVTDLSYAFYNCSSLTSLTLPESMPAVTTLYWAFYGCSSLTSLTLPTEMPALTTLYCAFYNCQKLEALDLSGIDTTKVTSYISICYHCYALADLNLDGWDLTSWTNSLVSCLNISNSTSDCNIERLRGEIKGLHLAENWRYYNNLDYDSAMVLINGLETVTDSVTITFNSAVYALLSDADIAVATNKGWTVASA